MNADALLDHEALPHEVRRAARHAIRAAWRLDAVRYFETSDFCFSGHTGQINPILGRSQVGRFLVRPGCRLRLQTRLDIYKCDRNSNSINHLTLRQQLLWVDCGLS